MRAQQLFSIIENFKSIKEHFPGKKELQKTVYLLQKKGLDSGYSYRFHFYGPYSDALDEDIQRLAIQGLLEIQMDEQTHRITLADHWSNRVSAEESNKPLIIKTLQELKQISPRQLELMATIVFLLDESPIAGDPSEKEVISLIRKVKGEKYSEEEIGSFFQQLKEQAYI